MSSFFFRIDYSLMPESGEQYAIDYPFRHEAVILLPDVSVARGVSGARVLRWAPGCHDLQSYPDDSELYADGIGQMRLDVVDVFKPGRYPTRVFYIRQFQNPDGEWFGSKNLQVATITKFRRLVAGYAHEFRVFCPGDEVAV